MFLQELKDVVLPNYPLVLSLLNSSIENSNLKPIVAISKPPE